MMSRASRMLKWVGAATVLLAAAPIAYAEPVASPSLPHVQPAQHVQPVQHAQPIQPARQPQRANPASCRNASAHSADRGTVGGTAGTATAANRLCLTLMITPDCSDALAPPRR
jgi:hypothetical protein